MGKLPTSEIQSHLQEYKFQKHSFTNHLQFLFVYRRIFSLYCGLKNDPDNYVYPLTIFQNPYTPWEFIIALEPYYIPLEVDNWYPHRTTELVAIAYAIKEGDEMYTKYSHFRAKLHHPFDFNFQFWHKNKEINQDKAFRLLFHAIRHPDHYAPESIEAWAERLHKHNLFPVTNEIINTILKRFHQYLKDREEGIASDYDDYDYEHETAVISGQSPNDQHSNVMNQNNLAHQANLDNHANQLNPEHSAYRSSRSGNKK